LLKAKKMDNDVTVILDNAGGATLQIVNGDGAFWQNHYVCGDMQQMADDALSALSGADPISGRWDGDDIDEDGLLLPAEDDIDNGCYRVIDVTCVSDLASASNWGYNGEDLAKAVAGKF
jgi:hypothetical protein